MSEIADLIIASAVTDLKNSPILTDLKAGKGVSARSAALLSVDLEEPLNPSDAARALCAIISGAVTNGTINSPLFLLHLPNLLSAAFRRLVEVGVQIQMSYCGVSSFVTPTYDEIYEFCDNAGKWKYSMSSAHNEPILKIDIISIRPF